MSAAFGTARRCSPDFPRRSNKASCSIVSPAKVSIKPVDRLFASLGTQHRPDALRSVRAPGEFSALQQNVDCRFLTLPALSADHSPQPDDAVSADAARISEIRCICRKQHVARMAVIFVVRFRLMRSLQKTISVHSSVFSYFNKKRSLLKRDHIKQDRTAALAG